MNKQKLLLIITSPIALLASGHLVADLYSGFIVPILPFIAKRLDISLPMAGMIIALSGLTSSFLQPIYGYFSDRISKRFFVVWGLIIASVFISLTGVAFTFLLLSIVVIIGNVGVGLYHPQATAYAGKITGGKTNLHMGIFVAGGIIGYALGPMISSSIVYYLGLEWTPLAAIPGLIAALLIYMYLPAAKVEHIKTPIKNILTTFAEKKSFLIPIILIVVIRSFILVGMSTYFPFEWEDNLGHSVLTVGIVMTIFSFAGGLSSIIGGSLAGKYGERKLLVLSFLIPLPILLLSLYYMKTYAILSFALYILGGALLESTISVNIVVAQRLVPKHIGIISGVTGGFCWGIAGFLMYPLGLLISIYGIYTMITSIIFLSILAIIMTLIIPGHVFNNPQLDSKN